MKEILVSVICNAYNHEQYIRETLEGFVIQKTDFAFEVLVHDDASTDKTADIIREYEAKYPDIIKPIYQTENQYSKGVSISKIYHYPRIKGKYIAFCEGDDYWTDALKLQKQFDALEKNPQVDICAHTADWVNAETKKKVGIIQPSKVDTILCVEDVIMGEGGYVATNSLMYRKELLNDPPPFRQKLSLDYTLQIFGSLRGGMLFLNDNMSAYRQFAKGSWTVRMIKDQEAKSKFEKKKNEMLEQLNIDTNYKYEKTIKKRIKMNHFYDLERLGKYKEMFSEEYRDIYSELDKKKRLKLRIKRAFPFLVKIRWKLRTL